MEDRLHDGVPLDLSSNERREAVDGRRPEITNGEMQILSNPPPRVTGGEIEETAEMQTFDASCQRREDHDKKSPNEDDDVDPAETEALGFFCSAEAAEAQSANCGDPVVQDHHEGETLLCRRAMDLLPVMQRENSQPVSDQREAEAGVETSSQINEISEGQTYHSVLHQMLQQQKHKPGRRFKKKTLMKMARLFVITKGWNSGNNEGSGSAKILNPTEDLFTSQSWKGTPGGRREEMFPPTCSAQGETLNKRSKRTEKPGSDHERATSVPETPDTQHQRTPEPTAEEPNRIGEIRSVSDGEEPKIRRKSRERTPKQRSWASKGTKAGSKTKHPSDQTSGPADRTEEETTINKNLGESKDTELKNRVEKREGDGLSASSGGDQRKRRSSVKRLQPAEVKSQSQPDLFPLALADEPTSCQSGDCAGLKTQEKIKKPRKQRNSGSKRGQGADQLSAGNKLLQGQNQSSLNPDVASLTKSDHQKPGKPQASTVWDSRATDQRSSSEMLLLPEKLNPQRKRPGRKKKCLQIEGENSDVKDPRGAFRLKREDVAGGKHPKRPGRRKKLKPDSGEKTLHFPIKSEAPETTPLDFPLMDMKAVNPPTETQSYRKRKPRARKYVGGVNSQSDEATTAGAAGAEAGGSMESFISSVSGSKRQEERRAKVKPEVHNSDETSEGTKCEKVEQREATPSRSEGKDEPKEPEEWSGGCREASQKRRYTKRSCKKRMKSENLQNLLFQNQKDSRMIENKQVTLQPTCETPKPENTTSFQETETRVAVRGRRNRAGLAGHDEAAASVKNVSEKQKQKRKRVPSFSNSNREDETVRRKKRGRRAKQEPNPDVFTASGGQTGPTLETGSTLDQTTPLQTEGVKSPVKRGGRKRCRRKRRTSNSKTLTGLKSLRSKKGDAGAPGELETCKTSNVKHRGKRRDALTMKVEDRAPYVTDLRAVGDEPGEPEWSESTSVRQEESSAPLIPLSAPTKTRMKKRRGRRRTRQVNKTKAKRPPISPLQESPADDSSLLDEVLNDQPRSQESKSTVNPEPKTCERLQKKKNLQCSFCLRSFRHISALTLHKRIHTGEKPYGCSVCAKRFSKLSQLSLHSEVHNQPPAASCPCCGGTFRSKTELILHFRVHLNEAESLQANSEENAQICSDSSRDKPFRCSVCSKEFTKKSTFKTHQRRHGEKPLLRRNMFSRSGSNEATSVSSDGGRSRIDGFEVSLGEGAEIVTPVFFKCPICKQLHRRWCHYVLHLQSHTSARPYRCDACGQLYDRAAETTRHCLICCKNSGEETACRGSLSDIWKEEKKDEEGVHPQPEQEDESMFPQEPSEKQDLPPLSPSESVPSMVDDLELHSPSPSSGFFPASDQTARRSSTFRLQALRLSGRPSGQMFAQWNKLWLHQRLHPPACRAFRCSRCELEFHFLGSYIDHLQDHAERPHARSSCPDAFTDVTDLNTHTSNCHSQQDGLKCSTCGKRFSNLMNLQKHKVLHKAGRSHVCLPCSRSFSCDAALAAHLQTHRKRLSAPRPAPVQEPFVFPYHCRKCNARFSSTDLLQAHQVCHFVAGKQPESSPERVGLNTPNTQRVPSESSQLKRQLPVSNKKHLFRYPHPDRLYVVPVVSSEPPVVVSDSEEPNTPKESFVSEAELELLVQSLIPEKRANLSDSSDCESDAAAQRRDVQNCAMCTRTFTDVATLHEHYRDHARGV